MTGQGSPAGAVGQSGPRWIRHGWEHTQAELGWGTQFFFVAHRCSTIQSCEVCVLLVAEICPHHLQIACTWLLVHP